MPFPEIFNIFHDSLPVVILTKIFVPSTLDVTKILVNIQTGTESGKILKISGKGIPRFSGLGRGNMYLEKDRIKARPRL